MFEHSPFAQLTLSNIRGFLREPEAIFWTYGFPLLMVVGLGVAFQSGGKEPVVMDLVSGQATNQIEEFLSGNTEFQVSVNSRAEAFKRLRRSQTSLVVVVTDSGVLEYHYDPTNPRASQARLKVDDALQKFFGRHDARPVRDVEVRAPGARYIDFLVPGLIGMNLMGGGMWGVGFALVQLRMKKMLKRLIGTPMRRSHFLLSMVGPRIFFFIPEVVALLLVAHFIFGVPIQGGLLSIGVVALAGALTFAGLGLLAGSRAHRIETISGILNVVMLPMWLCSGIFFSAERFPDVMQPFVQALPLTQLINALRAVILEGQPFYEQVLPLGLLALWMSVSFFLALKWFRWN